MGWFKLAGEGAFHEKVVNAGNEAYGAWCRAGQWSAEHLTEGRIPRRLALAIAPAEVWQRLVDARVDGGEHGLAEETQTGWQIHDYLDWNPTADEERAKRAARAEAGKRGAAARLRGRQMSVDEQRSPDANAQANVEQRAEQNSAPSPSPSPSPVADPEIPPECVDPGTGTNARADAVSHTHRGGEEGDRTEPLPALAGPDHLADELLKYPALAPIVANVAAVENLASGAAARGLSPAAIADAVSAFVCARGGELDRMSADEKTRGLGGFLANQKLYRVSNESAGPLPPDARLMLEDFREIWSKAKRRPLPPADGDGRDARKLVDLARRAAAGHSKPRDVARHVMRGYVSDGERTLVEQDHPLRLLPTRFASYGLPSTAQAHRQPERELRIVEPRRVTLKAAQAIAVGQSHAAIDAANAREVPE